MYITTPLPTVDKIFKIFIQTQNFDKIEFLLPPYILYTFIFLLKFRILIFFFKISSKVPYSSKLLTIIKISIYLELETSQFIKFDCRLSMLQLVFLMGVINFNPATEL